MYRYILFLKRPDVDGHAASLGPGDALQQEGLCPVVTSDNIDLYASPDTPVIRLSPGSVLIGHVFSRSSNTPIEGSAPPSISTDGKPARDLIENFWGEYLLIHVSDDKETTVVMRDPSGGVDCLYSMSGGFITSDVSIAVRAHIFSRTIDWDFIRGALLYPHLKTGHTALLGLHELLPGYQLSINGKGSCLEQTWNPWDFVAATRRHRHRHEAQADVRHAIATTVKSWAEADATLLLELSGGLDSSIVAAGLQDAQARIACCNLTTPVPGADERQYARQMADLLQTELHVQALGFESACFDFPPPAHAVTPSTWFLQHASNALKEKIGSRLGVNSFFSGGGGDTVFCYTRTAAPAADAFHECGMIAGLRAIRDLAELHQCTVWKAGRLTFRKLFSPPKSPRKPNQSFLAKKSAGFVPNPHPWFMAPDGALPGDRERIFDLAGTQVFKDGLERGVRWQLRMPLLSQPVMEACLKVPSWMWIAGGRNRAVARDAFADRLPAAILHRRSKGTFMNYSGAFYRRNRHCLREYLLTGQLEAHGLLDADALRQHFDHAPAPRDNAFMRIFDLCAAENWIRHQV